MDVFVTYVLGVDFTPPILLGTYYRVKTAAESMRLWERCPLLLARGTCASWEERKGSKPIINHPECQSAEPKTHGKARIFPFSFPKGRDLTQTQQRVASSAGIRHARNGTEPLPE